MIRSILVFLFLFNEILLPQVYKGWFLDPLDYGCGNTVIGYANRSYYGDTSAIKNAFLNACENYLKQHQVYFHGGQAFWTTEAGTYWMGNNFTEDIDTSIIYYTVSSLKIIDTLLTPEFVAVLVGDKSCTGEYTSEMHNINVLKAPLWINTIPQDGVYHYAVGLAPSYYHERSSWEEAEKIARRNLASNVNSKVKSLEKKTEFEYQEIKNEDISVMLTNCEIIGRWKDTKKSVFYVLMRMPKSN